MLFIISCLSSSSWEGQLGLFGSFSHSSLFAIPVLYTVPTPPHLLHQGGEFQCCAGPLGACPVRPARLRASGCPTARSPMLTSRDPSSCPVTLMPTPSQTWVSVWLCVAASEYMIKLWKPLLLLRNNLFELYSRLENNRVKEEKERGPNHQIFHFVHTIMISVTCLNCSTVYPPCLFVYRLLWAHL